MPADTVPATPWVGEVRIEPQRTALEASFPRVTHFLVTNADGTARIMVTTNPEMRAMMLGLKVGYFSATINADETIVFDTTPLDRSW